MPADAGGRLSTNRTVAWIAVAVVLWCAFNWSFVIGTSSAAAGGGAARRKRSAARDLAETLHEVLSAVPGSAEARRGVEARTAPPSARSAPSASTRRVRAGDIGGGSATAKDCDLELHDVPPPDKWKQNACDAPAGEDVELQDAPRGHPHRRLPQRDVRRVRPCAPEPPKKRKPNPWPKPVMTRTSRAMLGAVDDDEEETPRCRRRAPPPPPPPGAKGRGGRRKRNKRGAMGRGGNGNGGGTARRRRRRRRR